MYEQNCRALTKWPPNHTYGLNWPKKHQTKIAPKIAHSALSGGLDSCYIGDQPLCFHQKILSEVIRAQDAVPTSQSGYPTANMS